MRMLVLSPQPFFSPRGTPLSVYYRALVATELGVTIDLLTYGSGEDVDLPGVRILRVPRVRALEPVPVGPSVQKALLDVLMVVWTLALLLRNRYDVVHAHEESVFWASLLKPFFRYKLIYDMHSRMPPQIEAMRWSRSAIVTAFRVMEDMGLRSADAVITISPGLARHASLVMPDSRRHFLIENSLFEPIRRLGSNGAGTSMPLEPSEIQGRRIVLYAGTFEPYQGLDLLIPAFARVHRRDPEALLLLVGGTPRQVERYRALAAREGVADHCRFTGTLPKCVVEDLIRLAEVLVSPRLAGTSTPLKIYEQMASGRPLVATDVPAHSEVLGEDTCCLVPPTVEGLARGMTTILEDPELGRRLAARAEGLYHERYSRSSYGRKMRQLFDALA